MERARSLVDDTNLPGYLWTEAVATANYLVNRSPTRSNFGVTPEEKYSGTKPHVHHLRIFGCLAYLHVPKEQRRKLESKTKRCLFLGYDEQSKVYRVFDPEKRKVILSKDIICDEAKVGYQHLLTSIPVPEDIFPPLAPNLEAPDETQPPLPINLPDQPTESSPENSILPRSPSPEPLQRTQLENANPTPLVPQESLEPAGPRYPRRHRSPSKRLKDYFWTLSSELTEEPRSYHEANTDERWTKAMQQEIDSIKKNHTWDVVDRPINKTPITGKWIFKTKKGPLGKIEKLKARIVARGFQQTPGIDYFDTFAPVVRWSTIRAILAIAAKRKWKVRQMDVKTAFLNGHLSEEVYMEIPDGFDGAGDPTKVCKLNKALYGLKQAPKAWYSRIDSWLTQQGMKKSTADPNMYCREIDGKHTVVLLYVDDLLITGDNEKEIKKIQAALTKNFEMTNLGLAKLYLGVEFEYTPSGIWLHQRAYIRKLLKRYGMTNSAPCKLPMDPGLQLQREMRTKQVNAEMYRSLVGSLIYITNTRPDISYAVSSVSRYMSKPEEAHLQAAKQILKYLKGTADYALHLSTQGDEIYFTFGDADWGRDLDTRRSTSGIVHKFGESTIHWSSKLQDVVSLSTTEAEYRVLSDAAAGILHLQKLFEELKVSNLKPTTLYSDNQSCIRLVDNPILHEKTKHIDIRAHFIREKVLTWEVEEDYIPTSTQQADFLTKPVAYTGYAINREALGIKPLPNILSCKA